MAKTKKEIIAKLKLATSATIAFKGLVSVEEVDAKHQELIDHCKAQVASHNESHPGAEVEVVIKHNQVSAGASVLFLPPYPKTGVLVVKSKEYTVDGVYCKLKDIVTSSYSETALHWGFKTKAGSVIIIPK